ncbi:MAG: dephospho-CoA kinase [Promethearchaeota archaeon]|nr:MAG: dephospho-CoA kinase [Candidatus Lokiarchaeota archaeon]
MKTILGIVGMPGAGKSLAISIGKQYAPVVVMGDIVREETLRQKLNINSHNLGKIAQNLRELNGPDIIAQRCIQKIHNSLVSTVIVDGIRSLHEISVFQRHFTVIIIAIVVPDEIRIQRLLDRKRADDSTDMADILARDSREIQFGLNQVIESAQYIIDNSGSPKELEEQSQRLFSQLIKK